MIANLQLSTTEPKTKTKTKTKPITRTGTESQKWRSHGRLSVGEGEGEKGGKDTGSKQHKQEIENTQGEVKNSIGDGEVEVLICMTHGHELKGRGMQVGGGVQGRRE